MRTNPFSITDGSSWLTTEQVPHILDRILKEAEHVPLIYERLPWLRRMDVLILCMERSEVFSAPSPSQEATFTAFFSAVTQPIAEMISALYTTPLLCSMVTVGEILHRMAAAVGTSPLSLDVVTGVCSYFIRQRILPIQDITQLQAVTWRLSWHQSKVRVRRATGITLPIVILVTDEETEKILSFRCVETIPTSTELSLALYDALVYPNMDRVPFLWQLHPPAHLRVQGSLPAEIVQAAKEWKTDVEEVPLAECPLLCQWEHELTDRVLDSVQYLRILDRACERAFGYAPFLTKQRLVRRVGWQVPHDNDPTWNFAELRLLLPSYAAKVGEDGALEWRGWHYRDAKEDVLRYWAHEEVVIRPSPSTEAAIWVYWNNRILCYATADELRHKNGSYRPYWFPYPRLGE